MSKWPRAYVRLTDTINTRIGSFIRFLPLVLIFILSLEAIRRYFFNLPTIWAPEMAKFVVAGFFLVSGAYVLLTDSHVRMDALYSKWSPKKKAIADLATFATFPIYLGTLMWFSIDHAIFSYSVGEYSRTAWGPLLWPIKAVIAGGAFLLLLQSIAHIIRDIYTIRGRSLE